MIKTPEASQPAPFEDPGLASLPILLLRARVAVAARFNKSLRRHGLTEQQWRILRALSLQGAADVIELSRRCDLLPASLTRILRDLDARRLLIRSRDEEDARRSLANLTPEGRLLVEETMTDIAQIHMDIEGRFGTDNARDLRLKLTGLLDALEATP